ncbi:MAG: threonine/serine exporter family protein [Peptoniphilaceae bacterium]|nr:threonine/serine exporter family protein [Peptoniphilaceae bacterium]MDY6085515.1 threonine/serine exporter family protein [Peptoniphilaceae bacterium]
MERTEVNLIAGKTLSHHEKLVLDTALDAGVLLMENGAESYRVEETVERILSLSEHQAVDVIGLLTGLFVTLTLSDGSYVTATRRIKVRRMRLDIIRDVNQVSRDLSAGECTIEQAAQTIHELRLSQKEPPSSPLFMALPAAGFALMSGASILESIVGGLAACSMIFSTRLVRGRISGNFVPSFLHAFAITFVLGVIVRFFPMLHLKYMVIGGLISLFPGTTLTTGIRDTMKADYLSGAGNLLSAIVSAMALAAGTFFAMFFTGGRFV